MKLKVLFALVSSVLLSACSGVGSDDSKTENITAKYRVVSEASGITLEAQFYNASNGSAAITLDSGDIAKVYYSSTSLRLTELSQQGLYSHSNALSSNLSGENFRFAFERAEEIGAPNSTIYLPKAFTASSVQTAGAIFYTDPITVTWDGDDASDTQFNILRIYECLDSESASFLYSQEDSYQDLSGSAAINDSGLLIDDNLVSCAVTIELGRIVSSGVDERFKGGSAVGIQKRTLTFSLIFTQPEPEPEV